MPLELAPGRVTAFAPSSAEAAAYVDAHNHFRALHGVPPVQWSAEVADSAAEWASRAVFEHSGCGLGENLWRSTWDPKASEVVGGWYSEIKDYIWQRPEKSKGTGHFTQVCGEVRRGEAR